MLSKHLNTITVIIISSTIKYFLEDQEHTMLFPDY